MTLLVWSVMRGKWSCDEGEGHSLRVKDSLEDPLSEKAVHRSFSFSRVVSVQ
jgi:hypothetical protein